MAFNLTLFVYKSQSTPQLVCQRLLQKRLFALNHWFSTRDVSPTSGTLLGRISPEHGLVFV
jgi:hypothetical protein